MVVKLKRIYDSYLMEDGFRILVDRLWPRGVKKENARVDIWLKEVAPSAELRKWFGHDPAKWEQFRRKYEKELKGSAAFAVLKEELKKHHTVTLLYSAKDEVHNQAVVLSSLILAD
jgi:uncharacterized protein YeaO (DUF488 family)